MKRNQIPPKNGAGTKLQYGVLNNVKVKFRLSDRIKILFGATAHIGVVTLCEHNPGVTRVLKAETLVGEPAPTVATQTEQKPT